MTQQSHPNNQAEALRRMGAGIAARRKALGLTQRQLAEQLLVSDKTVSKWELGGSYPDPALLIPLAEALGITVDQLLSGRVPGDQADSPPPPPPDGAQPLPEPPDRGDASTGGRHWMASRLRQNAMFATLAGLMLAGGLPCLLLPLSGGIFGTLRVVALTLPAVLALVLLLCIRLWYRTRCRALQVTPQPLTGLAFCWLAGVLPLQAASWMGGWWIQLPPDIQTEEENVSLILQLVAGRFSGLAGVAVLPVLLAVLAALYLASASWQARPADLLPVSVGVVLACVTGLMGSGRVEQQVDPAWNLPDNGNPAPVWQENLLPMLVAGGVWLVLCLVLAARRRSRTGRGTLLAAWLVAWLLPAAVQAVMLRVGIRWILQASGLYAAWVAGLTNLPLLFASALALLVCGLWAARQSARAGRQTR